MPEFQITCVETCRHFYSVKADTLAQAKAKLDEDGTQPAESEFMSRKIEKVMRDVPIAKAPRKARKKRAKVEAAAPTSTTPVPPAPAKKRGRKPGSKNKAKVATVGEQVAARQAAEPAPASDILEER